MHQILALRGFVRQLGLDGDRPADETVGLYQQAMDLAPNAVEKKRVLAGLGGAATPAALEMAVKYMDDAVLSLEAEVGRCADRTAHRRRSSRPLQEVLGRVIAKTKNETIRGQAQAAINQLDGVEPAPNEAPAVAL